MNWKINYWTLIAAIMAGSFIISYMNNTTKAVKWRQQITQIDKNVDTVLDILTAETNCDTAQLTIPPNDALKRLIAYTGSMGAIRRFLTDNGQEGLLPVNLGSIIKMKLPKCETIQMFEAAPDGEINLYLTLEDAPDKNGETDRKMISAIFSTSNLARDTTGNLDEATAGGAAFYDFINPCPPICGDN